jgi:hypothetical protein
MSVSDTDIRRARDEEARRRAARHGLEDEEPDTIERHIDATRADMRATLEALERRFSVDRLMELTIGRVRERGGEFAGNLTDAATQNPVPLLLTSIGLGWLMLTSRRGPSEHGALQSARSGRDHLAAVRERAARAAGSAQEAVASTRDTLQHAADSSREALRGVAQASRETLEGTAESLRSGATRAAAATREHVEDARQGMERMLDEQPLMLGALGLAAGAIIGALLPATEYEDRFLGETRAKAIKTLEQKGRAGIEKMRAAATGGEAQGAVAGDRPQRPH